MTLRFAEANPHFIARDAALFAEAAARRLQATRIADEP
jgi:hypothetical protein